MWLKSLLADLNVSINYAVPVFCDNQAAIDIALNPVQHARTKHIELDCHFVREKVQAQVILPQKIASKFQLADVFTKALGGAAHWYICSKLSLHNPCVTATCGGSIENKSSISHASTAVVVVKPKLQYKADVQKAMDSQSNSRLVHCVWA